MVKIYTKTGDKGKTSLYGGKRVSKADLRIEACGEVDELNSVIGVTISQDQRSKIKDQRYKSKIKNELIGIQNDLLEIGSLLANPLNRHLELARLAAKRVSGSKNSNKKMLKQVQHDKFSLDSDYLKSRIEHFEILIDELSMDLPELKNFILPGGSETGSSLHFTRSVCRRVERRIVSLSKKGEVDSQVLIYFNRLSDLLFVMARFANYKEAQKETVWNKKSK